MSRMPENPIARHKDPIDRFFSYVIERESIRIRREVQCLPRPWTTDQILHQYRFCNVFREDDRVTRWFREYVRSKYDGSWKVLPATVLFRWFNRIPTGEVIFNQLRLDGGNAFDVWARTEDFQEVVRVVREQIPKGPWVTGAYMINTKNAGGADKLEDILILFDKWWQKRDWRKETEFASRGIHTLQSFWTIMKEAPNLKDFMSYEVVTDLRHTFLLNAASDIQTWANPGPGARRGLNRIHSRGLEDATPRLQLIKEMQVLLAKSRESWPNEILGVKQLPWELREVEHALCEFDKYERARLGEGRPKEVFKGA